VATATPPLVGLPSTKSDFAYAWLREAILTGAYSPGTVLNQSLLAETLGISTTPLRESLRRLSAEGLVELESHRDARVTALSADEARGIIEMRRVLDPLSAELAAERRTERDIEALVAAQERLEARSDGIPSDGSAVDVRAHREFHTILYRSSHNPLLVSTLDLLWDKAERYRTLGLQASVDSDESLEEKRKRKSADHAELVDSIKNGDAARAGEVMRRHIKHSLVAKAAEYLANESLNR